MQKKDYSFAYSLKKELPPLEKVWLESFCCFQQMRNGLHYNRKVYTVVIYLQFSDSYGIIYADKQVCYATIYSLDGQCRLGATS